MSDIKNTVCFFVDSAKKGSIGLTYVVHDVLKGLAGVATSEIFCLQDYPKQGVYDITFHQEDRCLHFLDCLKTNKASPVLKHIKFLPMYGALEKPMIVQLFNPQADIKVVMEYLKRYCDSVRGEIKQQNLSGDGKYKLWVRLKFEPSYVSGIKHPPATFSIAGIKGFLTYPGQLHFQENLLPFGCCPFENICYCCGEMFHDGGDPQECDFCGKVDLLEEYPTENGEEEDKTGHEEAMEDKKRLKTQEDNTPTTGTDHGGPATLEL